MEPVAATTFTVPSSLVSRIANEKKKCGTGIILEEIPLDLPFLLTRYKLADSFVNQVCDKAIKTSARPLRVSQTRRGLYMEPVVATIFTLVPCEPNRQKIFRCFPRPL